ncbi:uncharacterized protein LOC125681193 isoform X5 [Ostrea edulis]|uniref:uncharacterized protein LOC125681193 isoform X6 n=1 Tax=Ostrea edulis TaxID=37623 RepID=UPI0024AF0BF7|nr:uncharacterized protein LOC125681193 isoform X6 [Ostrea edulis]XP_056011563.1 uncharacterized protein LOC125681193 isoform X5 [Ostrea edulis]
MHHWYIDQHCYFIDEYDSSTRHCYFIDEYDSSTRHHCFINDNHSFTSRGKFIEDNPCCIRHYYVIDANDIFTSGE